MRIDINKEIEDVLEDFSDTVTNTLNKASKEAAKQAKKVVTQSGGFKNRTGGYRKSWKMKKEKGLLGVDRYIVHAGKEYPLTHLLEFGHVIRSGGRTRAYPHIKTAEKIAEYVFVKEVEDQIGK